MSRRATLLDVSAAALRHAAGIVAGVVTVALVSRRLGDAALGYWSVLGTTSFLLGVADLGLSSAILRAIARDDRPRAAVILRGSLPIVLGVATLLGLLASSLLPSARGLDPADARRAIALSIMAGVAGAYAFPFRALVLVTRGARPLGLARALGATLQVAATVVGLAWAPSLSACALGLLLGMIAETGLTMAAARGAELAEGTRASLAPSLRFDAQTRAIVWAGMREGAPALVVNLAVLAAIRVDLFVLGRVSDLSTLAGYAVAARAVDQSWGLAKQASTALLPKLGARGSRAAAVRDGTALLGSVVMSGMPALALAGAPLLRAWAGPVGASTVAHTTLLLLGGAAMIASMHEVSASALAISAPSAWRGSMPLAIGSVVNLAVAIGLAPRLGAWAVAGSTLVGNAVTCALVIRAVPDVVALDRRTARAMFVPPLAAAAASATCSAALAPWATGPLSSLVVCALGAGAGLAAALLASRAVGRAAPADAAPRLVGEGA